MLTIYFSGIIYLFIKLMWVHAWLHIWSWKSLTFCCHHYWPKHFLVSIHVLAGRTTMRDASRCIDTNDHTRSQPSQQKPATSQQCRTCWTFAMACDSCAANMLWLWSIETNNARNKKDFLLSEKKELSQN